VSVLRFGEFELDTQAGELRRRGALVRLQQQPAKVLSLLARRAGELVTREEIRAAVWGGDTFVNYDQGLNFCVRRIRAALDDPARTPRFVETLPRRGYRFIARVETVDKRSDTPAQTSAPPLTWIRLAVMRTRSAARAVARRIQKTLF